MEYSIKKKTYNPQDRKLSLPKFW